jgi:hypothetical protein
LKNLLARMKAGEGSYHLFGGSAKRISQDFYSLACERRVKIAQEMYSRNLSRHRHRGSASISEDHDFSCMISDCHPTCRRHDEEKKFLRPSKLTRRTRVTRRKESRKQKRRRNREAERGEISNPLMYGITPSCAVRRKSFTRTTYEGWTGPFRKRV